MTSTTTPRDHDRDVDIVVFGATSFVGRLIARYLLEHAGDMRLRFAGRNRQKLKSLFGSSGVELVVADASSPADMRRLAQSSAVVISTVGPFSAYGTHLVRACAEHGTHYLDLAGEADFVQDSVHDLHEIARKSGAKIIHSCGFDSVPSDLACFVLANKIDGALGRTEMVVSDLVGGMSGGTVASMLAFLRRNRPAAQHPYALNAGLAGPDPSAERDTGFERRAEQWLAPFFMASYNVRLVRRSAQLLGYGSSFRYSEYHDVGSRSAAAGLSAILGAAAWLTQREWGRRLVERVAPKPGEGPSQEQQAKGRFTVTTTDRDHGTNVRIHLDEDPGYNGTALMISEIALSLFDPSSPDRPGVLTPASGGGWAAIERLRAAGMEIE